MKKHEQDIEKQDRFERMCWECGKKIRYMYALTLRRAIQKNTRCADCARNDINYRLKLSKALKGRKLTKEWKEKLSIANMGHTDSKKTRQKKRISMMGANNPFYGKFHTEKTKKIIRLKFHKRMQEKYGIDGACPMYNPSACNTIDIYGKENGYKFQHALNGGEFYIKELGYWVDGYDKQKNVVIEYYESHHKKQVKRDSIRIREIKNVLGCKIIILKEWKSIPTIIN